VDLAEEEQSLSFALELVFGDDPTPRREGDEDKAGEGEPFAKRRRKGKSWVRVSDR